MAIAKEKLAHLWERDPHDWYVEPSECSAALFALEKFSGPIWDPACGIGRILTEARAAGLEAIGSDIIKRNELCISSTDFLKDAFHPEYHDIVMNPPFSEAEAFVRRALAIGPEGGKVAAILPLVWVSGFSSKRDWLPSSPLKTMYPISPRPSMPPGRVVESGIRPGNGTKDFAWLVWQIGYAGEATLAFMNTNKFKKKFNVRPSNGGELNDGKSTSKWSET